MSIFSVMALHSVQILQILLCLSVSIDKFTLTYEFIVANARQQASGG